MVLTLGKRDVLCCATEEFKGHRLNHPPCPVEASLKAILGNRKGVSAWEGQTMFPNYLQIRHLDHEMGGCATEMEDQGSVEGK